MLDFILRRASARGLALMVAALLFGLTPLAAYAATINVDGTTCTLPDAIMAANTDTAFGGCTAGSGDDTLLLGDLTHSLITGTFDFDGLTATPSITTTIIISGGSGSGAIVQRTGVTNYRLLHVGATGDLTLQNVTVRYGRTDSNNDGGGIYNTNRLTLINSHIFSNTASDTGDGGGIENYDGATLTLLNSSIISNTAGNHGGGIENNDENTLIITNTLIFANVAGEDGGAIENYNSVLSITDSQIISNTSGDTGGGIDNYSDSTLTLTNSLLISNTAVEGGGIYNYNDSTATITDSEIRANRATLDGGGIHNADTSTVTVASSLIISNSSVNDGGGIFNTDHSKATITDAEIIANHADDDGGGVYAEITSTVIITASQIISNSAGDDGGGLVNHDHSTTRMTDTLLQANYADDDGGAIRNNGSALFLTTTQLISNSADYLGGGLDNDVNSHATLNNSTLLSNTAVYGGGINNYLSHLEIIDSQIRANVALTDGGGIDSEMGVITITNSIVNDNHAAGAGGGISTYENSAVIINSTIISGNSAGIDGGGIHNALTSTVTISDAQILANSAISMGGGIYNRSMITVTGSKLNGNSANVSGGALYQPAGQSTINQSCIVNNSDTAVVHTGGNTIDAANNWWGSPDGPGPVGPGSGDSITANVTFSPFLASTILGCSSRSADLAMSKRVSPSGNLGAGQPVTYTLNITNNGTRAVGNIYVSEAMPAAINVSHVITAPGTSFNGSSYVISELLASEAVTIMLVGNVSSQLNQNMSVTNTATLTHALSSGITKTTTSKIALSELTWGDYFYVDPANNFAEGDTLVHIEVKMITPTMYATVTAQIVFTPTNPPFANTAALAEVAATAPVTFTPGSTSQEVVLTIPNTGGRPRAVELSLQEAKGATVGPQGILEISLTDKIYLPRLRR